MSAYPIGPVEKMRRKMKRELERKLLKKDEVIKQKDEEISQKDELLSHKDIVITQLTKTVIKQFGSEGYAILKESGISESDLEELTEFKTAPHCG